MVGISEFGILTLLGNCHLGNMHLGKRHEPLSPLISKIIYLFIKGCLDPKRENISLKCRRQLHLNTAATAKQRLFVLALIWWSSITGASEAGTSETGTSDGTSSTVTRTRSWSWSSRVWKSCRGQDGGVVRGGWTWGGSATSNAGVTGLATRVSETRVVFSVGGSEIELKLSSNIESKSF